MNFALGRMAIGGQQELIGRHYPGRRGGRVGAQEIIGQRVPPGVGRNLEEEVLGRHALMVREREYDKSRMYILGFTFLQVAAGATQVLTAAPQWPFRPYRLVVPSSIAPLVLINTLNVGQQPAFAADGSVSAETFSEVAWGTHILLDSASPGINITLSVTNLSAGPLDIRVTMLGDAARD